MDFLAREGLLLARPIRSIRGLFIEVVEGAASFHAAAFEKARGGSLAGSPALINLQIIEEWGRYLGRMHRLTKAYVPSVSVAARASWRGDDVVKAALRSLDPKDSLSFQRMHELMAWLEGLPKDRACYGLIHADLHSGNFFVHDGDITAFDFDDSCYHWFGYDLAIALISMNLQTGTSGLFPGAAFMEPFLKGYLSENVLGQVWLDRLELFGKYRAALMYHWLKTGMAEGLFSEKDLAWCRLRLPWCLEQISQPIELV